MFAPGLMELVVSILTNILTFVNDATGTLNDSTYMTF
jgi:hypothetical protein